LLRDVILAVNRIKNSGLNSGRNKNGKFKMAINGGMCFTYPVASAGSETG